MDLEEQAGGDGPGRRQRKCRALCESKLLGLANNYNYANLVSEDDSGKTVAEKSGCCDLVALT